MCSRLPQNIDRSRTLAAAFAAALLLTAACASKSNGDAGAGSPPPAAIHTYLAAQPVRAGDTVEINYSSNIPGATFECASGIGQQPGAWAPCAASGVTLTVPAGTAYVLRVRAVAPDGTPDADPLVVSGGAGQVAAVSSGSPTSAAPGSAPAPASGPAAVPSAAAVTVASPAPLQFQIGDFYAFTVPETMHVTEYATNKTPNSTLEFFRISTASDPYYVGTYDCHGQDDQLVSLPGAASGTVFSYCQSTPRADLFKWLTSATIAENHLEVATDSQLVTAENHEYIDINAFDANYEYMTGRSRFEQLCQNQHGNITEAPPSTMIAQDFWGVGVVMANFVMCTTDLPVTAGPGIPTRDPTPWRNTWWVGAFFLTPAGEQFLQYECLTQQTETYAGKVHAYDPTFCGNFANPSFLEVTYVTKTPYPNATEFAAAAYQKFEKSLIEIQPVGTGVPAAVTPTPLPIGSLGGQAAPAPASGAAALAAPAAPQA